MLFKRWLWGRARPSDTCEVGIAALQVRPHKQHIFRPRKGIENWFDGFEGDLSDIEHEDTTLATDLRQGDAITQRSIDAFDENQELKRSPGLSFSMAENQSLRQYSRYSSRKMEACAQTGARTENGTSYLPPGKRDSYFGQGDFLDLSSSSCSSTISGAIASTPSQKIATPTSPRVSLIESDEWYTFNCGVPKPRPHPTSPVTGTRTECMLEHEETCLVKNELDAMLSEPKHKKMEPQYQCPRLALPSTSPFIIQFSRCLDSMEYTSSSTGTSSLLNRRGRTLKPLKL